MELIVTDRASIEEGIIVRDRYALISIRDPDRRPVRFRRPPGLVASLSLAFHDAEPVPGLRLPSGVRLIRRHEAETIWEFVYLVRHHVGAFVCQCEQGISRSSAVALALAEALGVCTDEIHQNYQPNQYVYRLLKESHPA